jgi:hypothetical protein
LKGTVGGIAVLSAILACGACGDPTDPTNSGLSYYMRNDTSSRVQVLDCSPCDGIRYTVEPGADLKIPTYDEPAQFGDEYQITDKDTGRKYYEYVFGARDGQVFPISARRATEKDALANPAPVIATK